MNWTRPLTDFGSPYTRAVARRSDLYQASFESLQKDRKYLNYGYTVSSTQLYEERQQQLCLEVFQAAEIRKGDVIVDVGFGSGEQDFLLMKTSEFARLIGFNIAERQVRYANERAGLHGLADKLSFRLGEAERLPGLDSSSVDRVLAIECAFYFDRPRFYERAAQVLKPGGLLVLADIAFADRASFLMGAEGTQRLGTQSSNRSAWEKHFRTRSVSNINARTWPGAQMTVWQILKRAVFSRRVGAAERRQWIKMAVDSQLVTFGLQTSFLHYDLIVLEKPSA